MPPIAPNAVLKRKAANAVAPPKISTRDFLNTLFYYRWTAFIVILGFLVLGGLIVVLLPPTYRAEARLLTLYAGYYDMQLDRSGSRAAPSFDPTQVVNVEAQILASPELHRAIIKEDMGPTVDSEDLDKGLRRFEDRFHIEKLETSNVIELTFVDSNPAHAAHILERLIDQYFRQRAGVFTQGRVAFLVTQRDKVKNQLDKANSELIAFQRSHEIVNIESQISSAVALRSLLQQRQLENDNALVQDRSALDSLSKEAKNVPAIIELFRDNTEAAHALDTMQLTLLQLQARRADLASRYMEGSPFVEQMDHQIGDVRASIAEQKPSLVSTVRTGHNTYYDTVQDRLVRLTSDVAGEAARKDSLEQQNKEAEERIQYLIAVANQLHRMEIDRDLLVDSFKNFSRQVEQARIEQNQMDTSSSTNVRIIQAPIPPTQRSNPPLLFIAASIVAGLLAAGLSILVLSSLRETFLSPEEIERSLHLPVLSAPIRRGKPLPLFMRLSGKHAGSRIEPVMQAAKTAPRRPRTEFGRTISAINNSSDARSKIVLLLAFRDDDGSQTVVQGLAEELERRSTRPVLILDLTSGDGLYGKPDEDGLLHWPDGDHGPAPSWVGAEHLPGSSPEAGTVFSFNAVERQHIVIGRLRPEAFLPVGRQSADLFDILRQAHDYIIIAVPPVSASFVGIETAIVADATLLTIRAEATRKPVALSLKSQILDAGGSLIGVAMTNRYSYIPSFVYRFL